MHEDVWKAYVREDLEIQPRSRRGVLSGLSFAVKDVFAIQNHINAAGNPDWLRTHEAAGYTAPAVEALLAAGASLKGITHTDELMYSLSGENVHYGTPVNPKAPGRVPGGSSSGSAAAVAGGLNDFALGTDTGGSIRIPSSYCGLYGFRPTHGRIPIIGVIPLAPSFDTVGWMAREAGLLRRIGDVLGVLQPDSQSDPQPDLQPSPRSRPKHNSQIESELILKHDHNRNVATSPAPSPNPNLSPSPSPNPNPNPFPDSDSNCMPDRSPRHVPETAPVSLTRGDPLEPFKRLYMASDGWALLNSACRDGLLRLVPAVEQAAAVSAQFVNIAREGLLEWSRIFRIIQGFEIWMQHGEWIRQQRPAFGPGIAERFAWTETVTGEQAEQSRTARSRIRAGLKQLLGIDGLLVIPTAPCGAPKRGASGEEAETMRSRTMQLTCIAGLSGFPQVTVPIAEPEGLPLGLSILAGPGEDGRLLRWTEEQLEPQLEHFRQLP